MSASLLVTEIPEELFLHEPANVSVTIRSKALGITEELIDFMCLPPKEQGPQDSTSVRVRVCVWARVCEAGFMWKLPGLVDLDSSHMIVA